jgi:hypothetical protein
VHLPGDRKGRDLSRRGTCRRPDRGARGLPPVLGVGLGPAGAGRAGLVAGRALAEDCPVGGTQQRLYLAGAQVEPEYGGRVVAAAQSFS